MPTELGSSSSENTTNINEILNRSNIGFKSPENKATRTSGTKDGRRDIEQDQVQLGTSGWAGHKYNSTIYRESKIPNPNSMIPRDVIIGLFATTDVGRR